MVDWLGTVYFNKMQKGICTVQRSVINSRLWVFNEYNVMIQQKNITSWHINKQLKEQKLILLNSMFL